MPSVDCLVLIGGFPSRLPLLLHLETALGISFGSQDEAEAAALRVISGSNISRYRRRGRCVIIKRAAFEE